MEKEKNSGLFNSCRLVENYNPYDKAVWLDTEDGKKPYLCVNERIEWYTRYCEEKGYVTVGIATEYVPELTKQGMITMKATVMVGTSAYTGYEQSLLGLHFMFECCVIHQRLHNQITKKQKNFKKEKEVINNAF